MGISDLSFIYCKNLSSLADCYEEVKEYSFKLQYASTDFMGSNKDHLPLRLLAGCVARFQSKKENQKEFRKPNWVCSLNPEENVVVLL